MRRALIIPDKKVIEKIYNVKGEKVMLDSDLAELYGVETRTLNQAVKRNINRFPEDFMFQLSQKDWDILRSQIVISNHGGRRHRPLVFTEQGVSMLSTVLNSEVAINVNIQIIRVFTRMRKMVLDQKSLVSKLNQIELRLLKHDDRLRQNEGEIELVFQALKQLVNAPAQEPSRKKIGYRRNSESEQ